MDSDNKIITYYFMEEEANNTSDEDELVFLSNQRTAWCMHA
jgi:hypothetical protein